MRKIVFLEEVTSVYLDKIRSMAPEWEIVKAWEVQDARPLLKDAEIIGGWNSKAADVCLYEATPLRWVHTWSAGVNSIPFDKFKKYNIILTNSSGVHGIPISETLLGMMLAFTRKLNEYMRYQSQKKWDRSEYNGRELYGKTVGILGLGAIGQETARLAKAFGMRVLGLRFSGQSAPYVDQMYKPDGLEILLSQSDYVVNVLPLTKDTYHIMGEKQFKIMKPTAYYFNAGRGATHDEAALIKALREKWIAGAGIDAFEKEPLPTDSPLWEMDNVIITPHTAGNNDHYLDRVMDIFIPNFRTYLASGKDFINLVDLDKQY